MSEVTGKYDIKALEEGDIVEAARNGRSLCGVYFLILNSSVVYVGQSTDIPNRISKHKQDKSKRFDRFHYVECNQQDLDEVEQYYIRKFKPPQNKKLYGVSRRYAPKPVDWLKTHPVFSRFCDITLREWMKRAKLNFDNAINYTPRHLTTFGDFYRWLKHRYPRLNEHQILPNDVERYFAQKGAR